MSEHTPTPWHWTIHDSSAASIEGPDEMMSHVLTVSPCRSCRGEEWQWGMCTNPTEANAAFIVKTVNSHDALVTELKLIADWRKVNLTGEYEHSLRDVIRSMLDCADRALASIKETAK